MKRFWKQVAVAGAAGGHTVTLDGRPVHTPARTPLTLPAEALARAIAAEWQAQGETVDPSSMPLMQLAATALDRVAPARDLVVDEIAAWGDSDLLCYRASEPPGLVARQEEVWAPLLGWLEQATGAALVTVTGILHAPQPEPARARLREAVVAFDDMGLAALHAATAACGSLVIALALARGRLDADTAFAASQVDEDWQIAAWGLDPEAERRREILRRDITAAARFLALSRVQAG